jgi:PAS domain S-box-containing protein
VTRTLSFRARSVLIVLATCAVAVSLACTAFLAYDRVTYRDGLVDRLRTQSVIIGTNTTAALSFGDEETARQVLGALKAEPVIEAACLFDNGGKRIASYIRPGGPVLCPIRPQGQPQSVDGNALMVETPVGHQGEVIGSVLLISDLGLVNARTASFLAIVGVVMAASLIIAFVMATRLQGAVVRPVLTLAETAKHVSRTRDYSVRAAKHTSDEVGALTDAFNAMLDEIETGERALQTARADLERRVHDRTHDLEEAKLSAERVAESLRLSEEQLRFLSDHVPVGIFRTDAKGGFTYANERLLDVLGMDPLAAAGNGWQQAIHPDDRDGVLADWDQVRSSGADLARELRVAVASEVRWVQLQTRQLRHVNGQLEIVGTLADVTERKHAERERERTNIERLEMSRQAGMAEVATGVLHNVGNVLNSVNVASSLLRDRIRNSNVGQLGKAVRLLEEHRNRLAEYLDADPRGKRLLPFLAALAERLDGDRTEMLAEMATVNENVDHIKQIIATQQTFARIGGLTEVVDLVELIEGAVTLSEAGLVDHKIHIVRDYQAIRPVSLDKHKVLQVLINLLSNAKQALVDSGRDERQIVLRSRLVNGSIRIEVEDNGVGIAPDNLDRIFRFGFTTKEHGHGFGLHGSALAAKQLLGSLIVHSDGVGRGACFALELPCPEREQGQPPHATGRAREPRDAPRA